MGFRSIPATNRWIAIAAGMALLWTVVVIAPLRTPAQERQDSTLALTSVVPRRAVLVCHCPDRDHLEQTWILLRQAAAGDDPVLRILANPIKRIDTDFLPHLQKRIGVQADEAREALGGEFLIGWMPAAPGSTDGLRADDWVLVIRRTPDTDPAVRRLWQKIAAGATLAGRVERRLIEDVTVEQATLETTEPADLTPRPAGRVPGRRDDEEPPRIEPGAFGDVVRVERRAMSIALTDRLILFAPGSAERLAPWIRAARGERWASLDDASVRRLLSDGANAGRLILAVRATPSSWVPPGDGGFGGRLGSNPGKTFLSQMRSLDVAVRRHGDRLVLDGRATVLPEPSWTARLLAALRGGARMSGIGERNAELVVRIDFERLWQALHSVLLEGWPAVAVAADSILEPLGGAQGAGAALLTRTLGNRATFFVFRPPPDEPARPHWALRIELADAEAFAPFESRLARLINLLAVEVVPHDLAAGNTLQLRAASTSATLPAPARRVYSALSPSDWRIAGSLAALKRTIDIAAARPPAEEGGDELRALVPALADPATANAASLLAYYEARPVSLRNVTLDGRVRRRIQTPDGTIEIVSPPPDRPAATTSASPGGADDAHPPALVGAALFVESPDRLRLQVGLRLEGVDGVDGVDGLRREPSIEP